MTALCKAAACTGGGEEVTDGLCELNEELNEELNAELHEEVLTHLCNEVVSEACGWRKTPHAYGDRGIDPRY